MKKLIASLLIFSMFTLTACGNKKTGTEPQIEVARNDWYGAIERISQLDKDAKSVVSVLDNNNYDIVMGNPNDYWSDGYYHFTFTPLESKFINYTLFFNESDPWETITANTQAKVLEKVPEATNFSFTKNDEHDYSYSWEGYDTFDITNKRDYVIRKMHLLYDASHNWAQLIESSYEYAGTTRYEEDFVQYAEIDKNHFALQCQKGRLLAEYDDNGTLVKMYYSRLGDDARKREEESKKQEEFVVEDVFDMDTSLSVVTEPTAYETNPAVYNSEDDSMFSKITELDYNWVMNEKTVEQYVVYENEVLLFRVKNKLSGEYEGFIISNTVAEPVLNETDGKYYDPVSGKETTVEEYKARLEKIQGQIPVMEEIISSENLSESLSDFQLREGAKTYKLNEKLLINNEEVVLSSSGDEYQSETTVYKLSTTDDPKQMYIDTNDESEEPAEYELMKYMYITADDKEIVINDLKNADISGFTEEVNGPAFGIVMKDLNEGNFKNYAGYDDDGNIYILSTLKVSSNNQEDDKIKICKLSDLEVKTK